MNPNPLLTIPWRLADTNTVNRCLSFIMLHLNVSLTTIFTVCYVKVWSCIYTLYSMMINGCEVEADHPGTFRHSMWKFWFKEKKEQNNLTWGLCSSEVPFQSDPQLNGYLLICALLLLIFTPNHAAFLWRCIADGKTGITFKSTWKLAMHTVPLQLERHSLHQAGRKHTLHGWFKCAVSRWMTQL